MSGFVESPLDRDISLGELRNLATDCRAIAIIAALDGSTAYMIMSETLSATELAAQRMKLLSMSFPLP